MPADEPCPGASVKRRGVQASRGLRRLKNDGAARISRAQPRRVARNQ